MAHTDQAFMRLNLGLLMVVSFTPFPTKLVAEHIQAGPEPERVAVMFYGVAPAGAYFHLEIAVLIMLLAAVLFWIPAAVLPRRASGPTEMG